MPLKVYELAEEYRIDPKALLGHLKELGIFVSSHMSLLDEDEVEKVRTTIDHVQKRQEVKEKRVKATVIRRRVVRPAPQEEPPAVEQHEEAEVMAPEPAPEPRPSEERPEPAEAARLEVAPAKRREPKRKEAKEAAVVIRKAAPLEIGAPTGEPAEETPAEAAQLEATEVAEATQEAAEVVEELPEEAREAKAPKVKKAKAARESVEPAKIVERPRPDVVKRLVTGVQPSPPPAAGPAARAEVEAAKKTKPKRRKALKAFEVVHQEKPARGRAGRKKEVIQLRDEMHERERAFYLPQKKKKARETKKPELTVPKAIKRKIRMAESITVGELAKRMGIKASDLIKKLLGLGLMATVNQMLDSDEASLVASEFGYDVERHVSRAEEILEEFEAEVSEDHLEPRPPVVTVMGHVDHGKTSLLDAIRESHVTDEEMGGITQHMGAYQVEVDGQLITFIDTPGHEAFTSLRARGAMVTDLVVLVVAADDGVMNQTREAMDHARAAQVPILVAINKIDKANADPDRVMQELANLELVPEAWGGDTLFCQVSAKEKTGLDKLLESILLQAELLELKANPDKLARGTVLEAKLDRRRGPVMTVLVEEGTLHLNDAFVAGLSTGKVRQMLDYLGRPVKEALPSTPIEVVGGSEVPLAGKRFLVVEDEKKAKDIEAFRREQLRKDEMARTAGVSLDRLMEQMDAEQVKELPVVIKGDVQGSIETLRETLSGMGGERVKIQVIHSAVGGITENDVNLASASNAIIIGFNVRPEARAQSLAEELGVDIRLYNVIYELIEEVETALVGMLEPTKRENMLGSGEVIQLFKISRVGTVAGTSVKQGKVVSGARARLVRDGVVVHDGKIASLRRYQDDVKEAVEGQECGIHLENFNDVKLGDIIEVYEIEEVAPEL